MHLSEGYRYRYRYRYYVEVLSLEYALWGFKSAINACPHYLPDAFILFQYWESYYWWWNWRGSKNYINGSRNREQLYQHPYFDHIHNWFWKCNLKLSQKDCICKRHLVTIGLRIHTSFDILLCDIQSKQNEIRSMRSGIFIYMLARTGSQCAHTGS